MSDVCRETAGRHDYKIGVGLVYRDHEPALESRGPNIVMTAPAWREHFIVHVCRRQTCREQWFEPLVWPELQDS